MLRGQVAVFLSCSEKFKLELGRPVRDALNSQGLRAIIASDEPSLPSVHGDPVAKAEPYLDASWAFVALCTADYELSDGTKYPRASIIDEIQRAKARPHLRDHAQVLKSPGVLLPSDITPAYDCLDVTRPEVAADVILKQLEQWGVVAALARRPAARHPAGAEAAADLAGLFADPRPGDHDEARRRIYPLLRDRDADRRRLVVGELHREIIESDDHARRLVASLLLEAAARLDAALVPVEMVEALAAHLDYLPRSCAANLLRSRAALAPLEVPVELLGRLAWPSGEDWFVWAPAMAAVQELVVHRRDAYVIFESLAGSAEAQDRHAVAAALLGIAGVQPGAVAGDLAMRLAGDADPMIAAKARDVMAAIEHLG